MTTWTRFAVWTLFACLVGCGGDEGGPSAPGDAGGSDTAGATDGLADSGRDAPIGAEDAPADAVSSDGDATADASLDAGPCGHDPCPAPWMRSCRGDGAFAICGPKPDGCLVWGPEVTCGAGTCEAGACGDGCTAPRAMILVDRSASMTDLLWDRTTMAISSFTKDNPAGAALGLRVFPGTGSGCIAGPIIAPLADNAAAIVAALTPPTVAPPTPMAAALAGLEGALSDPRQGDSVIVLLAGTETCAAPTAVRLAVQALRARGVTVHFVAVGEAADTELLELLAAEAGTEVRFAVNAADIEAELRLALLGAGACCVDGDSDGRGSFCDGGPDCDDNDPGVSAPSCTGRVCGGDGCGGSCGTCTPPKDGEVACEEGACVPACPSGAHLCDAACVDDADPAHCGAACDPCPTDPNGEATCDSLTCGVACAEGYHACDGACAPDDSPASCGASCEPCPGDPNGTAVCDAGACTLECAVGHRLCEGACAACPPAEGVAETTCDGASCLVASCEPGFVPCAEGCCDRIALVVGPAGGDGPASVYPSLRVDFFGQVHIAWSDRSTSIAAAVRYATGTWEGFVTETVAQGTYGAYGTPLRLTLDAQGAPHVAWRAGTTAASPVLLHAKRGPEGFAAPTSLADATGPWPYTGSDLAFAVPKGSGPTAVYPSGPRLSVAWVDGLGVTQGTVRSEADAKYTEPPGVVAGKDGLLDVIYVESVGPARTLRRATGVASAWTDEPITTGIAAGGGDRIGVALSPEGALYACAFTGAGLVVAEQAEGWQVSTVDPDGRQACSLAYAPDGAPHVVYRTLYGAIRHATRTDGAWLTEELAAPSGPIEQGLRWPSAAIDEQGGLHAAWWDQSAGTVWYGYVPNPVITKKPE